MSTETLAIIGAGIEPGDLATWALVIGSVVFSGAALWVSLLSRRDSKRAATAAERSAGAAERSAGAAERQVAMATAEADKYVTPWKLHPVDKSRYNLTNEGSEPAYDVSLTADFIQDTTRSTTPSAAPPQVQRALVRSGESITFISARTFGDQDDDVNVTWYREPGRSGKRYERRFPVP
ncbi:MAG: hypothetical protein ACRDG7_11580 [Candidatus Limnocylindria bacterium]